MDNLNYIENYLKVSIDVKQALLRDSIIIKNIETAANSIINCFMNGNKLLIAGNGGSAADSQHIAAEFVSRFYYDRPGLPAIALTTDTSALTAIGNDYGFTNLFSRQIEALGQENDIFIGISTSGNSENVVKAIKIAKDNGLNTIVLCGSDGKLKDMCDLSICVPSSDTPNIQECHITIGHIICAIVEKTIYPQ